MGAGAERLVGQEHELARFVGLDRAKGGLAVEHRDLGAGRRAAGDHGLARRLDPHDVEAGGDRFG